MTSKEIFIESLIHILKNGNNVNRSISARTIGKLKATQAIDELMVTLDNENDDVVLEVIIALGLLKAVDAQQTLLKIYAEHSNSEIKVAIVEALGEIAKNEEVPPEAISSFLISIVKGDQEESEWETDDDEWNEWWDCQKKAIEALGNLAASQAVPILLEAMDAEDAQEIENITFQALAKMGAEGAQALIQRLNQSESMQARNAAKHLETVLTTNAREALIHALKNSDILVCINAARSLAKHTDESAKDALFESLKDTRIEVRRRILEVFTQLEVELPDDVLARLLKDEDESVRMQALRTTSRMDKKQLESDVFSCLRDQSLEVVTQVIKTLGDIRFTEAKNTIAAIVSKLGLSTELRVQSVIALGKIGDQSDLPLLLEMIKDPELPIRLNSINSVADLGLKQSEEILLAALRGIVLSEEDLEMDQKLTTLIAEGQDIPQKNIALHQDIKQFSAYALSKCNSKKVVDALMLSLQDENLLVQEAAIESLGKLENADAIVPLIKMLESDQKNISLTIIQTIGKIPSVDSITALMKYYFLEKDTYFQMHILQSLTNLISAISMEPSWDEIQDFAIPLMDDPDPSIKKAASELILMVYKKTNKKQLLGKVTEIAFRNDGELALEVSRLFHDSV